MKKPTLLFIILLILSCSNGDEEANQPTELQKFNLTVTAGSGGSVSSSGGTYDKGTKVTITATPDSEYLFKSW
ncbi:InlB B-repeat-containing protein, partial [Mariniphaga sediminis]|uniref:InlB B-repeat-containing protein n=1 Tax=Mariniphaga sediminis TaxID=1628158 RepID=UPI003567FBF9